MRDGVESIFLMNLRSELWVDEKKTQLDENQEQKNFFSLYLCISFVVL